MLRLGRTLALMRHPVRSIPAFAGERLAPAVGFALLTALPLACLRGIVPYTKHLQFGPLMAITLAEGIGPQALRADLLSAIGKGLLMTAAQWLALTLPFVSLCRSFGQADRAPALRLMLYAGWLLPLAMGGVLFSLLAWSAPNPPGVWLWTGIVLLDLVPLLVLFQAMRSMARFGYRTGPLSTLGIVLVPMVLLFVVQALMGQMLGVALPGQEP